MRVFVTGATGFIGSVVVQELLGAGHQVLGLTRSAEGARALAAAGAQALQGTLDDVAVLRRGAAAAEGAVHLAFPGAGDLTDFAAAGEADRRAITALGEALAGAGHPLVVTSGLALLAPGRLGTEADGPDAQSVAAARIPSEEAALTLAARGVPASVVRLALSVHGDGDHGFLSFLVAIARAQGRSAYVGDGQNRWPGVHRRDAARLFRLALERGATGARYHGAADTGVPFRAIAEAIGRGLGLPVVSLSPEEATAHFGDVIAAFAALDNPVSSALTRQQLGWEPGQPGILADLAQGGYF